MEELTPVIGNVLFVIQIFGLRMILYFQRKDIKQSVKKPAKQTILKDSTTLCVKGFHGWFKKTLSFSKKIENHIGAIWSFIHHYNQLFCLS